MQRDKVVLFDLGGVLVENTGQDGLMALLPYTLDTTEIWRRWLESPCVRQFESGRMSAAQFASAFIDEWQLALEPSVFIDAFTSWPKGFFPGARELLRELKDRHHLACLSNTNVLHWQRFPEFPVLFHSCFASHQMGIVKPDREVFEHVLQTLKVSGAEVYFFDDLLPNVEAARGAGINAFHVRSFAHVEPILRRERLYG